MFECINVGDSNNKSLRLLGDTSILCLSESHSNWKNLIAIPTFIIYGIFAPILFLYSITKKIYLYKTNLKEVK